MTWAQVSPLIINSITPGLHLDPRCQFKIVIDTPPYQCFRNGFNGLEGYKVIVGRNSFIEITLQMLEVIHSEAMQNNAQIYNHFVFRYCYPNLYNQKPCYVHAVGKIFLHSNVANQTNATDYSML
jgi:hypothetical protein